MNLMKEALNVISLFHLFIGFPVPFSVAFSVFNSNTYAVTSYQILQVKVRRPIGGNAACEMGEIYFVFFFAIICTFHKDPHKHK